MAARRAHRQVERGEEDMHMHVLAGAVVLACFANATLGAQSAPPRQRAAEPVTLTRGQAVAQALAHNPQLEAARQQVSQARARVTQARALPDPELAASMEDQTRVLRPGDAGSKNLGVGLTIPFPTRTYLRGKVAGSDVSASEWSYMQARQTVAAETVQGYDALLVSLRHGRNLAEASQLAEQFLEKTQARFNAGTVAGIDVVKARVEVARARNDIIANERDVANARAALNRLLGRVLGATLEPVDSLDVPDPPPLEVLEQRALAQRPEVQGLASERKGASAATSLASQFWLPDVSIGVSKDVANGVDAPWTTELGFGIPLFFWQHRNGEVAESQHHELELLAVSRDLGAQVSQEVRAAHAAAATALRQVVWIRDELLPAAREAHRIATTSYGLGGSSALEVLDAQRTLLEAEGQYTDALGAANDARAQLRLAIGAPLSPDSLSSQDDHDNQ
jgi:cobalt-zinc-cadmium efflux system outer membrane protein